MSNKKSAWLPVIKARKFAINEGLVKEAEHIEGLRQVYMQQSLPLDYIRALYMKLFEWHSLWETFVVNHWTDANKPIGRTACKKYQKRAKEVFSRYPKTRILLEGISDYK